MERIPLPARLAIAVAAASILALAGATTDSYAASRVPSAPASATQYSVPGELNAVVAFSPSDAWAAGSIGTGGTTKTLLLHWNGRKWSRVTESAEFPGGLTAMSATSAGNIWAIGDKLTGPKDSHVAPLILHYNGADWHEQTAGVPTSGELYDVSAAGKTAWVAGGTNGGGAESNAFIMRFVSGQWEVLPVAIGVGNEATDVVATSATSAMALTVGTRGRLVLQWNGHGWIGVPAPKAGIDNLQNIGAGHDGTVWAVGNGESGMTSMLWTGKSWQVAPETVAPPGTLFLVPNMVRPIPGGTEWAVGFADGTLIEHWNGKSWNQVPSPDGKKGSDNADLDGVSAVSKDNAWAVGSDAAGDTLILHWNGTTWS